MKNLKNLIIVSIIITSLILPFSSFSQGPPPPPSDHGQSGNQQGGNAPIGGGLFLMLGLGLVYGGYKGLKLYKEKNPFGFD